MVKPMTMEPKESEEQPQNGLADASLDASQIFAPSDDEPSEESLQESLKYFNERVEAILKATNDGIYEWDIATNLVQWSDRLHEIVGTTPDGFSNQISEFIDRVHPEDLPGVTSAITAHFQNNEPYRTEFRLRKTDGEYIWVVSIGEAIRDDEGNPLRMVGSIADISQNRRTQGALRESEDRYRTLFEYHSDAVFVVTNEGNFVEVNQQACKLLGYEREELLKKRVTDFLLPDQTSVGMTLFAQLAEQGNAQGELRLIREDGREVFTDINCTLLPDGGYLASLRDTTMRKQLEKRLLQSQKLEDVGRLAGGVAHDFNNMLSVVMGYATLAIKLLPTGHKVRSDLQVIHRVAQKSADLTQQLLAFSRRQIMEPRVIDFNDLILDMDKMLRQVLSEDIEFVMIPARDLGLVKVDPTQLEQVIMNFVVNARDAMPNGGKLTIETENFSFKQHQPTACPDISVGEYIQIIVKDTGIGMTEETQSHIFDPFFTTKGSSGSGLGLSTCYGVIKQSEGHISVSSIPGEGTTFKVYLPRVEDQADLFYTDTRTVSMPQGTETILLVEDDQSLRQMSARVLEEQGYVVIEASHGQEALEVAEAHITDDGKIDLVLTDVIMPQMGAIGLAERIQTIVPDVKILFTSGYSEKATAQYDKLETGSNFLKKPFTAETLTNHVRQILDE